MIDLASKKVSLRSIFIVTFRLRACRALMLQLLPQPIPRLEPQLRYSAQDDFLPRVAVTAVWQDR